MIALEVAKRFSIIQKGFQLPYQRKRRFSFLSRYPRRQITELRSSP
jgi:hypothetical protein